MKRDCRDLWRRYKLHGDPAAREALILAYTPMVKHVVDRMNISLDTLDPQKYEKITRIGNLQQALDGIHAAKEAGFTAILPQNRPL